MISWRVVKKAVPLCAFVKSALKMELEEDIQEECNCSCDGECQHDHCHCGHCSCENEDSSVQNKKGFYPELPRMEWDADDFADWD